MSHADRDKWDKRYREGSYGTRTYPSELLAEWLPQLQKGRALDVACGAGRNALYLAAAGYVVDENATAVATVDVSDVNTQPTLSAQTFDLRENSAVGTVVGTMVGLDLDSSQTLKYSISGSEPAEGLPVSPLYAHLIPP